VLVYFGDSGYALGERWVTHYRSEAEEVVGAEVVRLAVVVKSGSPIPTSASNSNGLFSKELQIPETASASESASEIKAGALPSNYPGTTGQPLVMAGFAARRV
jgi:hypothetical protein